jgi:predicted Zn-dependent protease with MMP-like domain
MRREEFQTLVLKAIDSLPSEFQRRLENVAIVIEDWPTQAQLNKAKVNSPTQLLGLYEGVPRTKRGHNYGLVLPDKITIFRKSLEAQCHNDEELRARIEEVVRHEIAHHFGLDENTLRGIEAGESKRFKSFRSIS